MRNIIGIQINGRRIIDINDDLILVIRVFDPKILGKLSKRIFINVPSEIFLLLSRLLKAFQVLFFEFLDSRKNILVFCNKSTFIQLTWDERRKNALLLLTILHLDVVEQLDLSIFARLNIKIEILRRCWGRAI